jgi:hypothetical protein
LRTVLVDADNPLAIVDATPLAQVRDTTFGQDVTADTTMPCQGAVKIARQR